MTNKDNREGYEEKEFTVRSSRLTVREEMFHAKAQRRKEESDGITG